jgi:LmbE family N-acetylglucosaminyl deacetylase
MPRLYYQMKNRPVVFFSLIAVTIACLVVLIVEFDRRHSLYWYDVGSDYSYTFDSADVTAVPVRITGEGIRIPSLPGNWDTVVILMRLEATLTGAWFEPTLEVIAGDRYWRQTLERSANGLRYITLDADMVRSTQFLELSGHHVRWDAQDGELFLFSAAPPTDKTFLVLAPHPDDAEIAAFGLYSNRNSYVVTVSAGDYVDGLYAHLSPEPTDQDLLRGRARVWDSLVVPTWGGVSPDRVVNLGYRNGSLRDLYNKRANEHPTNGASELDPSLLRAGAVETLVGGRDGEGRWQSIVTDLAEVVAAVNPDVIVTPHPALDAAPDHQYTTVALLEALDRLDDRRTTLLVYTNHHVLSEYYPFGPSDSAVTLPPWFDSTLVLGAVFSYPLTDRDRMDKLFALEAMHDLRAPPRPVHGGPTERFLAQLSAAFEGVVRNPLGTYSYMRRAVRENEVFFVVEPEDRGRLQLGNASSSPYAK